QIMVLMISLYDGYLAKHNDSENTIWNQIKKFLEVDFYLHEVTVQYWGKQDKSFLVTPVMQKFLEEYSPL
ncbi:MAG: hypothetical protein ACI86H_001317, partial [bacterium]